MTQPPVNITIQVNADDIQALGHKIAKKIVALQHDNRFPGLPSGVFHMVEAFVEVFDGHDSEFRKDTQS